jgi:tetratricopeptide (TPR) repeat protein
VYATLGIAFSQLGQDQLMQASETYQKLAQLGTRGSSFAASGLGDLATLQGRFADAVRILRQGVSDDLASQNVGSAAAKLSAIAYAELSHGRNRPAIEAAEESLRHSSAATTRFLAARILVEAGDAARARPLIDALADEPYNEPRAYAKIVEGLIQLKKGDARKAVGTLREANTLFDTWIGLFDLGRASLEAGLFAQADSAFDTCLNARRGEALSLFLDEETTYAYLAPVHYYLGRAREGLKSSRYSESYREYLRLRGNSTEDPLLAEVRKRAN